MTELILGYTILAYGAMALVVVVFMGLAWAVHTLWYKDENEMKLAMRQKNLTNMRRTYSFVVTVVFEEDLLPSTAKRKLQRVLALVGEGVRRATVVTVEGGK